MTKLFHERGLKARICKDLKIRPASLTKWDQEGRVPPRWCPAIERVTGIPSETLNPDVRWHRVREAGWPKGLPVLVVVPTIDVSAPAAKTEPLAPATEGGA